MSDELTYSSYLGLGRLLDMQAPRSDPDRKSVV